MPWAYALFATASDGMRLSRTLRAEGVDHAVCPTPRHLAASCGIALRFLPDLRETVEAAAAAHAVSLVVVQDPPMP